MMDAYNLFVMFGNLLPFAACVAFMFYVLLFDDPVVDSQPVVISDDVEVDDIEWLDVDVPAWNEYGGEIDGDAET